VDVVTRVDMSTREWHELVKPVLPHAVASKEFPELSTVRLEPARRALYALASDRYTLGAERHPVRHGDEAPPVHLDSGEVKATLRLFRHTRDEDPPLTVTIDTVSVPVMAAGLERHVPGRAVTLQSADGTRAVMRDRRDPARDHLAGWRTMLAAALTRDNSTLLDGLDLSAWQLARWAAAARPGERLTVYTGPEPGASLLVVVEDHFAGLWMIQQYLESPAKLVRELPWAAELAASEASGA
jgi:hypothetical protein